MAEFKSRYKSLAFFVEGERKQFANGGYATEDPKEIEVLKGIQDAELIGGEENAAKKKREPKQTEE